jgi:hypothetical protein
VRRVAAAAFVLALAGHARAGGRPPASDALFGFRYALKTGLVFSALPPGRQDVSFAVSNHFGWAVPIGPIVISPGASVPAWFFESPTLGLLAEVEVHVPLWYLSPYGVIGGGGALTFASEAKPFGAFRAGGGATVFPASWIGVGFQTTYLRIYETGLVELVWPLEVRF